METQIKKIKVGRLYKIAEELRKNITDENEIEKIDRTEDFLHEIEEMIENGEIIIININAKMRLGKSTLAISIGKYIYELLKKHGHRKQEDQFGMENIDRDQQEHSKRMRDPKTEHTVRVVDESNEMETTGENATTEKALSKMFSDVQAGRYVHKVCCSPKEMVDPNADILLSVIGIDKEQRITHAKIYYRYYEGGQENTILLGYIRWPVNDIIQTWEEKAKKLFYKKEKTQKEEKELNEIIKKDFYTEYVTKKYEKMEILTKEGIFRPRILDYAEIIMKTTDRLRKLTKLTNVINPNVVRNYIKIECRSAKIPLSIVGEELATREAMGLLDLYKSLTKLQKEIKKTNEENISNDEKEERRHEITNMMAELANAINIQEEEYKRYTEINKKYNNIIER